MKAKVLVKDENLCVGCGVCETVCSSTFFKEKNREKSRVLVDKGDPNKIKTCTQCGVCIDICPVQAISRDKNGVVKIDKDKCVGCYMCVGFCPEGILRQHDDYIEPFKCISCGLCAQKCPTGALKIEEKEIEAKEILE